MWEMWDNISMPWECERCWGGCRCAPADRAISQAKYAVEEEQKRKQLIGRNDKAKSSLDEFYNLIIPTVPATPEDPTTIRPVTPSNPGYDWIAYKNFIKTSILFGTDTIGSSNNNDNTQIQSESHNPLIPMSTISPDTIHRESA